ncbi:MAG TPA: GGDEF domain-containing protein, partial [Phycisphaerae bacterium]|nr:GGDEF domain-containing protein [Phycisphaerae bacterium]
GLMRVYGGQVAAQAIAADIAARYGGDEFIALLPHTPDADAEALAARIRQELRERAARSLPGVPVDVSVGIAGLKTTEALSPELLVREVDKALYAVKRSGKGRIARAPARPPKRHTCPTENGTTSPR